MEVPLVLTSPRPDRLVYGLPIWYRAVMGLILAIVVTALLMGDSRPGILAWLVLALLLLGALYEDSWTFDAAEGRATHRAGLVVSARSTVIEFSSIERFRVVPLVKGTIPGSAEEQAENAAALAGKRSDDGQIKRFRHKKPFLSLEIECTDGTRYLVDHLPARNGEKLRSVVSRLATLCGKPVTEA
jgi:hypothetical protein